MIRYGMAAVVTAALIVCVACSDDDTGSAADLKVAADAAPGAEAGGDGPPADKGGKVDIGGKVDKGGPAPDQGVSPDGSKPTKDQGPAGDQAVPSSSSVLVAVPPALHFGARGIGCEPNLSRSFELHNPSAAAVTIQTVALTGCTGEFKKPTITPGPVAAGGKQALSVSLIPATVGAKSCAVVITAADGKVVVPITAMVSPKTSQTDSYTQTLNRKVDILFAMDTSGSMMDDISKLKAASSTFASAAAAAKLDFHLGAIPIVKLASAGVEMGQLYGTPPYITSATTNIPAAFANQVNMSSGSGTETAMDAVKIALSPPFSAIKDKKSCASCPAPYACKSGQCHGPNVGFRRPGASLEVILFSDEKDQSSTTEVQLSGFLSSLVNPLLGQFVRVHGLLGVGACGVADVAWTNMAAATGGKVQDLCAGSYATFVKNLADRAFGLQDQFPLSRKPVQSSIQSTVNGKAATGVVYDAKANAVVFATPPADKSSVKVSYTVSCK